MSALGQWDFDGFPNQAWGLNHPLWLEEEACPLGGGKNRLCRMYRSQLAREEREGQINQEFQNFRFLAEEVSSVFLMPIWNN